MPTILCVENEWSQLHALQTTLEDAGCHVLSAVSGAQAMELLSHEEVDGVVIGYRPGEFDRLSLRMHIQHLMPDLPLLLLSGSNVPELALRALGAYVHEPGPPESVLSMVTD